jgi:UDP-GlcNAc:undecaprenyl-phosphate/decaprenyl-phosphate GlcNAc-1-phosphate transferase
VGAGMSFLIAFVIGVALTPILGAVGRRIGLVDRPGELKIHTGAVPVTGGAAVVAAVLAGVALAGHLDPWLAAAGVIALGGGLIDDLHPFSPWLRLLVQTAAGGLLVMGGLRLEPFGGLGAPALVVATVAACNAVNMVDGQDGLAGGLGAIAALGLAGVLATIGVSAVLPFALAGGLLGFLVWNRPPARVFLGDGGAYAVGVFLTVSAAQATAEGWHGLLAAGACLGVLSYELVATIVRRLVRSEPAIRGDRDHSYDRLGVRLGSRGAATIVMWCLAGACSLIGVTVVRLEPAAALVIVAGISVTAAVLDARLLPVSIAKGEP